MKSPIALSLLALIVTLSLTGCQQPAAQLDDQTTLQASQTEKTKPKPKKQAPPKNQQLVSWQENCSVQQAFDAGRLVLDKLDLATDLYRTNSIRTRDPKTGRSYNRQVAVNRDARSDGLSAILRGKSTAGIDFDLNILLVSPETSKIVIKATSSSQSKEVLQKHCRFLEQQIRQAIQQPEVIAKETPYPETMIFDCDITKITKAVASWAKNEKIDHKRDNGDKYFASREYNNASGIQFVFNFRLIGENKTKLELKVSNYEGKEEFNVMIKSLVNALDQLKKELSGTTQKAETLPYPETIILNQPVGTVDSAIDNWARTMRFEDKGSGGDSFYRHRYCRTASRIYFDFTLRLIDTDKTKLNLRISDYKDKEEFPMILKSLMDTLENISAYETVKPDKSKIQTR